MWSVETRPAGWPHLTRLVPERILDEYDGPRLFTVRSDEGDRLLAYQCAEEEVGDRFILVPVSDFLIREIEASRIPLREALFRPGWAWLVDRAPDGRLGPVVAVDLRALPEAALPAPGALLATPAEPLLRIRMSGQDMASGRVPASVVRQAADGATGAVRALLRHALRVSAVVGRPADTLRRLYDLPAVEFAFGSFEIAFGSPLEEGQQCLEADQALERVRALLTKGLAWATDEMPREPEQTGEWSAIVEALAKLAPPQRGRATEVAISGMLAGSPIAAHRLTRATAERIRKARERITADRVSVILEGYVREFDKDKLTFILRDHAGETLRNVGLSEEQFEDVLRAFDTDRRVAVVVEGVPDAPLTDLISLTFSRSPEAPG